MLKYVSLEQLETQLRSLEIDIASLQGAKHLCDHLITLAKELPEIPASEPVPVPVDDSGNLFT